MQSHPVHHRQGHKYVLNEYIQARCFLPPSSGGEPWNSLLQRLILEVRTQIYTTSAKRTQTQQESGATFTIVIKIYRADRSDSQCVVPRRTCLRRLAAIIIENYCAGQLENRENKWINNVFSAPFNGFVPVIFKAVQNLFYHFECYSNFHR